MPSSKLHRCCSLPEDLAMPACCLLLGSCCVAVLYQLQTQLCRALCPCAYPYA